MNFNYDLSILLPGVRNENWVQIYDHVRLYACKRYKYEIVFCGPRPLPPELAPLPNIKYIKDFGTPTRALHLASMLAEGKYITWLSDDAHLYHDSIDKAVDLLLAHNPEKDLVGIRYCEGENHSGNEGTHPMHYSYVATHPDLQAPNVNKSWLAPGVLLLANEYYRHLGGFDTKFEHINLNICDLAYRAQMNGSKVVLTPFLVMNCDWDSKRTKDNSEVVAAFFDNDRKRYWDIYSSSDPRPIQIDLENWRETDVVWKRKRDTYGF